MLSQMNRIYGNLYVMLRFTEDFEYKERMEFFGVMAAFCGVSCIVFATLPLPFYNVPVKLKLKDSLLKMRKHFLSKNNLYLIANYCYFGMQFTFSTGMFSNCLGFTSAFPLSKFIIITTGFEKYM